MLQKVRIASVHSAGVFTQILCAILSITSSKDTLNERQATSFSFRIDKHRWSLMENQFDSARHLLVIFYTFIFILFMLAALRLRKQCRLPKNRNTNCSNESNPVE